MGVTIHFEGHLRDRAAMKDLLQFARRFASERGLGPTKLTRRTLSCDALMKTRETASTSPL